jgi:flagellar M-ring protein FliF
MEQLKTLVIRARELIEAFRTANRQLFKVILAAAALAAVTSALFYIFDPGAPVMLASNLSLTDRTALALRLRREHISFTLGTDSISVPSREITQAKSLLWSSPGFSGGTEDFSLFNNPALGESDFDEQVNYQRSLQGEIERTLMDIHGVDNARVMLAMANPSAFGLGPAEVARASVMLTISPGAIIDSATARAIAHLVAGSVRGLSTENVTITGNDGVILYPPQRSGELSEAIVLRNDFERRLQQKVAALLTRIMGQNRYAVEVAVDVDTSRQTREESLYRKADNAILSEEHSVSPTVPGIGGIPGLTSNLPTPSPSPATAHAEKNASAANPQMEPVQPPPASKSIIYYKPSVRQIKTFAAPVRIKRITVAAVLDGTYEGSHFIPLPAERLAAIKSLLGAAVGAQPDRGDSVEVQSAALSRPYVPPAPSAVNQLRDWFEERIVGIVVGGMALLGLLLTLWIVKRIMLSGGRPQAQAVEEMAAQAVTAPSDISPQAVHVSVSPDFEGLRTQLNQMVARDPAVAAEVLRKWLIHSDGATDGVEAGSEGE